MERIQERDAHAFELLFARYREILRRQLLRTLKDDAAADDLVQEVFLRVWTRAEQWHRQRPFKAWLFRIGINLALNHLRGAQRRRERPLRVEKAREAGHVHEPGEAAESGWLIDLSTPGPEALLEQEERQRQLQGLVDTLPHDKREVFRMAHEHQMEIQEIADALGIPKGTVKSRLYHARKRLAQAWRQLNEEE